MRSDLYGPVRSLRCLRHVEVVVVSLNLHLNGKQQFFLLTLVVLSEILFLPVAAYYYARGLFQYWQSYPSYFLLLALWVLISRRAWREMKGLPLRDFKRLPQKMVRLMGTIYMAALMVVLLPSIFGSVSMLIMPWLNLWLIVSIWLGVIWSYDLHKKPTRT